MDGLWMSELSSTALANSDAFHSNQTTRPPAPPHSKSHEGDRVWPRARALRVLVVAGKRESANALARLVRRGGHAVRATSDGCAAVRMAAERHPDVVMMDMKLPLSDGCRLAQQLRLDYPSGDCLIIAATEWADEAIRQQCIEAGIDLLLVKPVDPEVIDVLLMLECARVNSWRGPGRGPTSRASAN